MSVEVQLPLEPAASTPTTQSASTTHSCPSCGTNVAVDFKGLEEARGTIRELEAQMELLKQKAAAAGSITGF